MQIIWELEEKEYENYRKHQQEHDGHDCDGYFIGCVRTGDICFDILEWGNHLWFDLYVGGIEGYDVSCRKGYEGYPYSYDDSKSFVTYEDVSDKSYKQFVNEYTEHITKHILSCGQIIIDKANEELKLW